MVLVVFGIASDVSDFYLVATMEKKGTTAVCKCCTIK
jgi:hypothetical protein